MATLIADIAEVEREMAAAVVPSRAAKAKRPALAPPSSVEGKIGALFKLRGIGVPFSTVLGGEVYYRTFRNRRGVGQ